jgi:hypothetical protein
MVVVAEAKDAALQIRKLSDHPEIDNIVREALRDSPDWLSDVGIIVITPPEPQIAPGDPISSPNIGTVGCRVSWTGGYGFLTAGHVATASGRNVYDGRTLLGTVRFSQNPTGGGTARCADVAVVEAAFGTQFSSGYSGAANAPPNTNVTIVNSRSPGSTIIALASYFYLPHRRNIWRHVLDDLGLHRRR